MVKAYVIACDLGGEEHRISALSGTEALELAQELQRELIKAELSRFHQLYNTTGKNTNPIVMANDMIKSFQLIVDMEFKVSTYALEKTETVLGDGTPTPTTNS